MGRNSLSTLRSGWIPRANACPASIRLFSYLNDSAHCRKLPPLSNSEVTDQAHPYPHLQYKSLQIPRQLDSQTSHTSIRHCSTPDSFLHLTLRPCFTPDNIPPWPPTIRLALHPIMDTDWYPPLWMSMLEVIPIMSSPLSPKQPILRTVWKKSPSGPSLGQWMKSLRGSTLGLARVLPSTQLPTLVQVSHKFYQIWLLRNWLQVADLRYYVIAIAAAKTGYKVSILIDLYKLYWTKTIHRRYCPLLATALRVS